MAKKRAAKWRAWNKGIELGQKDAFTPDQAKRIRQVLARRGGQGLRDFTLFSVAIDTMLQGPELLNLTVKDVRRSDGEIRSVIEIARPDRKPPVRCALSKVSANALGKWIAVSGEKRTDYIFPGRGANSSRPMSTRQMSRLLKSWITEAGLDAKKYGIESLRRTKAHSPGAPGPLEDRVHSAFLTHRQNIRPDRYFSSLRYLISAHIGKVRDWVHGCDATLSTYRPQYLSKQPLRRRDSGACSAE